jgi:hypothetical protein
MFDRDGIESEEKIGGGEVVDRGGLELRKDWG